MQKTDRILQFLLPTFLFGIFFLGMAFVQFSTPNMPDNDGFYHIKTAWLMRTDGIKPEFPWLPLSILNAREFYDHHFLFHVALIPFTFSDLRLGAKWAAVTFASLAFLAVWYLFHRQRVPHAWLWALGLLGASDAFLFRMSITRAQSLSLAILAIGLAWMLEGKYRRLGLLAFLYVWFYDAFPMLMAVAVLYILAIALIERRLELRPLVYIGLGTALGMLVNPYFPFNIIFAYRHMAPKLLDATSVRVGNEWFPYDTGQLLKNSLPSFAALISGALALGLSGRKMDTRTTTGFFIAILFGLMLFQARRFVEYFPPFALIFAAFAWSPLLSTPETAPVGRFSATRVRLLAALKTHLALIALLVAVSAGMVRSLPAAQESVAKSKPYGLYAGASAWLVENTPPGSLVFQTDWDDFPRLFFYNTHNVYLIGLDPTYMQLYDPDLYDLWVNITKGNVKDPSTVILNRFGSRYIMTDLNHSGFLRAAGNDPGLQEVFRDEDAVIFQVLGP